MKWKISHTIVKLQLSLQRQGQEVSLAKVGKVFPSSLTQVSVSLLKYCRVCHTATGNKKSALLRKVGTLQLKVDQSFLENCWKSRHRTVGLNLKKSARFTLSPTFDLSHSFPKPNVRQKTSYCGISNSKPNFFTLPVSCAHIIFVNVINFAARVVWQCQPVLW